MSILTIYLLLYCVHHQLTTISASASGFYIDNGLDQTRIERLMTKQETLEVEHDILNLLGLPNRPKRKFKAPLRKSAPRFLMDVYKTLMDESNGRDKRNAELNLSGEEQQAIDESDIIMTFESQSNHVSSVRHERGKRLWFNVSELPVAENIVGAELRIYKNSNLSSNQIADYTVAAYQLTRTNDGERELEFVTSVNTSSDYTGWLELNMTGPLSSWVAFPESNKGLYLSVHPIDKPAHEIRPEEIGLVSTKGEDEKQPFLVAFLKATNHVKVRTRRDTKLKRTEYNSASMMRRIFSESSSLASSKSCKIETLYINFKDLEWQDWIIAPEGYSAYYCSGECRFPLNAHMNATNHAIVQTLVHLMKPNHVPKPCCAPTKLTPISVLYFLEDSNVVLKKYKKMVVKSCGCH